MTTLLICGVVVLALVTIAYMAACAGAERLLSLREWLTQSHCTHKHRKLYNTTNEPPAVGSI